MRSIRQRHLLPSLCWLLPTIALAPISAAQDPAEPAPADYKQLSTEELQEVVGPFALYPDELVRYILPASTHPDDVLAAAGILKRTDNKPREDDPEAKKLHESVQALLPFPDVINMLAEYPDWLGELGDAVAYQEADVMEAIQAFRRKAHETGNLETTEQQTVIVEQKVIRVVAANPQVIYVPVYQPTAVVVKQPSPAVTFAAGVAVGAIIWGGHHWGWWGGCSWHSHCTVNVYGGRYHRPPGYRPGYRPGGAYPGYRPGRPGYGPGRPGYGPGRPGAGNRPPSGTRPGAGNRPPSGNRPSTGNRPPSGSRPSTGAVTRPPSGTRPRPTSGGAFGGSHRGGSARQNSRRGATSRGRARGRSGGGGRGGRR